MITKNAFFCKKFYNVAEIFYICILFSITERKTQNFSFSNFQNELRQPFFFVTLCLSNFLEVQLLWTLTHEVVNNSTNTHTL